MPLHKDLTGSDLHEPKGVSSASGNTTYFANGSGSGTWRKVVAGDIDTSSVFSLNKALITLQFEDIADTETLLVPLTSNMTLTKITFVLHGAITAANSIVTVTKNSATAVGSQTITYSGSGEGTTFTLTTFTNNTFAPGDYLKLVSDGGATGPQRCSVLLEFNWT